MDKENIALIAQKMENKEDILSLINNILHDELIRKGMGDKFYPFTMRHLNYYCNPNNTKHRYIEFNIKKKSGGTRHITAPRTHAFMLLLDCVNEIFKSLYTPSKYAMGFIEGKSVIDNASVHKGMNYIFNTDLKDFFPSIEQARVWKRIQIKPLNLKRPIANVLAGLCSMRITQKDNTFKYILPQGAPTSPIITNMICDKLDRRLAGLAKRLGLNYTRYADDITFSSMHNVYQNDGVFLNELQKIISSQGFTINLEKTRLQKLGSRQEVTGIIVSDKLNVTQNFIRNIRNILYIWDRYGYNIAYTKFASKYKEDKGHLKKNEPDMIKVIKGKLMYIKMIKGQDDSVFMRMNTKFDQLLKKLSISKKVSNHDIKYIETTPLKYFEKNNSTEVIITTSETKKSIEGNISSDKSNKHRYAYFIIGNKKFIASVNKDIKVEEETNKNILAISNCKDSNNNQFWLIHKIDKKIHEKEKPQIDVDELNAELDSLLKIGNG